ncbi:MAG: cob(I)yrinic acid a,c-diamide adenosyltransferase [Alphaproteobacteria bacterium]
MVKLDKIYTKLGDDGSTRLSDGTRRNKNDLRVEAYGTIDEANSFIGLLINGLQDKKIDETIIAVLIAVQHDMFDLGADISRPFDKDNEKGNEGSLRIVNKQVIFLEMTIDKWNSDLPPLTSFILPSGGYLASLCHIARTIVRRAERLVAGLMMVEAVNQEALKYLNRLSDMLFVLARWLVRCDEFGGQGEVLWKPGKNR